MKKSFLLAILATVLTQPLAAASCKIVLAYYADWNKPGYSASTIPYSKLTHICHAFVIPNADGTLNVGGGFLEPAMISGAHAAGVKVLVSVGGATGSAYFSGIAASNRTTFANSVRDFILTNNYDGVDIDWEFPNNATDRSNFNLLVQALRSTFTAAGHPEWLISGAFSSDLYQVPQYDLATLKNSLNFFNVMTYDYHGSWSAHMGHNAPLGRGTGDPENISGQASINYYLGQGVPAGQLVYGLPFYGYDFPVEDLNNGCPGGNCGGTAYIGYLTAAADNGNGWTRYWDAAASSPYLRNNTTAHTITYDDPQSIQLKSAWALNTANLGGVFMWELSQDYSGGNQPLLDAMRAPLACGSTPQPTLTVTPTRPRTPLPTSTRSSTATSTFTATLSPNPTGTSTATPSVTPSRTTTGSYTRTVTPVSTSTCSVTPSSTASTSATSSATPSSTAQVTMTVSPSHTASPAGTLTSTPDPSPSAISTSTASVTSSATPSVSASATATRTVLPSATATSSATPSATVTRTVTTVPTLSATLTKTPLIVLPTSTATRTVTAHPSATCSVTPGITADPTQVPTLVPTTPPSGTLIIQDAKPVPNPNATIFYVQLSGWADSIELGIYSSANTLITSQVSGPHYPGWTIVYLPPASLNAANGTYFYTLQAKRGGVLSPVVRGTLVMMR